MAARGSVQSSTTAWSQGGTGSRRRPFALAAILSFVWPGLGQWFQGRRGRAKLFALPLIPVPLLALFLLADGFESAALRLFDPTLALIVLILVVVVGIWRLLSLGELVTAAGGPRRLRKLELAIVIALAVVVVETHLIVGNFAVSFYQAGLAIFDPGTPNATPLPSGQTAAPSPAFSQIPTPATDQSRINVLLLGVDSSQTRTHALTDTIIVASVDPVTGTTSMVSLPRDIARFPMPGGATYSGKINSFANYAANHPKLYPEGPIPAFMREIGFILGIPIHYYGEVNLEGFVKIVAAMDYVTVTNDRQIDDYVYGGWTDGRPIGFHLSKGVHQLDAQEALAYARSRKGVGDSDFTRAARQQELLAAVRARLADPAMLPRLPQILQAISETLRTNFPADRLDEMLLLARRIDDASTRRVVLGPPYSFHPPTGSTGGTYILQLKPAKVEALSIELYGEDSAFWVAGAEPSASTAP